MKLKCVNYEIFWKNMIFAKKNQNKTKQNKPKKKRFLKLENIHNLNTYFHPLRNIVLKLFNDKCKAKVVVRGTFFVLRSNVKGHGSLPDLFSWGSLPVLFSCWPLPDLFSCWPLPVLFSCWPLPDLFSCWPFPVLFSCWPLPDLFSWWSFISIFREYSRERGGALL